MTRALIAALGLGLLALSGCSEGGPEAPGPASYREEGQILGPEASMTPPLEADMSASSPEAISVASEVAGMAEEEASAYLDAAGMTYRVVARDGEYFPVTADYSPDRVNLIIEEGVVASTQLG